MTNVLTLITVLVCHFVVTTIHAMPEQQLLQQQQQGSTALERDFQRVQLQVRRYVDETYKKYGLFSNVLVAQGDKLMHFSRGYSDVEHGVELNVNSRSKIGSTTKQFTAIAVLQLQEQGLLSINDTLAKYMPDFPFSDKIHLYHLLIHSAGLPDYPGTEEYADVLDAKRPITLKEFMDKIHAEVKRTSLDFEPGTKWDYSNTGYAILSYLVEQLSGMPYPEYIRKHVFQPAGMDQTYVDEYKLPTEWHTKGYDIKNKTTGDGWEYTEAKFINMDVVTGAGAIVSNTLDLLKYHRAMQNNVLISAESKALMEKEWIELPIPIPGTVTPGSPPRYYGLGVFVTMYGKYRFVTHGGGIYGFVCAFHRIPELDLLAVNLVNIMPVGKDAYMRTVGMDIMSMVMGE